MLVLFILTSDVLKGDFKQKKKVSFFHLKKKEKAFTVQTLRKCCVILDLLESNRTEVKLRSNTTVKPKTVSFTKNENKIINGL